LSNVRLDIGENRARTGDAAEALKDCNASLEIRLAMLKERPASLANRLATVDCLRSISDTQTDLGQGAAALESLRRAQNLMESARAENPRNVRILNTLYMVFMGSGGAHYRLGRVEESIAQFEQTVPILKDLGELEPQVAGNRANMAGTLYNIAAQRKVLAKFEASLDADRAALAIRRELVAQFPKHPSYRLQLAASLGNTGGTFVTWKQDFAAALPYYEEASAVLAKLASAHPDVAEYADYLSRNRSNVASVLMAMGRNDAALAVFQTAEPYVEKRVRDQPNLVQPRLDLGFNLSQQAILGRRLRRYDEAEQFGLKVLETLSAIPETSRGAPDAIQLLTSAYDNLGTVALLRGRLEDARGQFDRSVMTAEPDPKNPLVEGEARVAFRRALEGRAETSARLGRLEAARSDWSHLASIQRPGEPEIGTVGPILIRAWSGDAERFLAEAEELVASGAAKQNKLLRLAKAACVAIPRVTTDAALKERLAAAATKWLRSARDNGELVSQADTHILIDPHFDVIAQRPEIRLLRDDLSFPTQPFAPETTP
jgi:tetratricopeptide (TPR) repeat protein